MARSSAADKVLPTLPDHASKKRKDPDKEQALKRAENVSGIGCRKLTGGKEGM